MSFANRWRNTLGSISEHMGPVYGFFPGNRFAESRGRLLPRPVKDLPGRNRHPGNHSHGLVRFWQMIPGRELA